RFRCRVYGPAKVGVLLVVNQRFRCRVYGPAKVGVLLVVPATIVAVQLVSALFLFLLLANVWHGVARCSSR
ncbi:MAG: hypothetical protein RPR91_02890, partial [Colwellia sp.]